MSKILAGGRFFGFFGAILALATLIVFWPATRCDFINYDDPDYVTKNPRVQEGLTWHNVEWAFASRQAYNWHPLTWLSMMLDANLFGPKPFGFHFTNLALHTGNAVLLFGLLIRITGARWRSLLVASLFAWHPLQVESVVWVAERKSVLSVFFGLLALIFYCRYAQRISMTGGKLETEGAERQPGGVNWGLNSGALAFYLLALGCFALGLMSKPTLVIWPFILLVLDYWPLKRWEFGQLWPPILEKIPFCILSAAVSVVTFKVHSLDGDVMPLDLLPFASRLANVLASYCGYLGKLFWPEDLAIFYPLPHHFQMEDTVGCAALLLGLTGFFGVLRRRQPALLAGWMWYLGVLVPVIGLVQVGSQALADRHAYISSIGIFIIVVWGGLELFKANGWQTIVPAILGIAAVAACAALTRQQIGYWRDSETVFKHALAVTGNTYTSLVNLGSALDAKGQADAAIHLFEEAIIAEPKGADAYGNLGTALLDKGKTDEAIANLKQALQIKPNDASIHNNLGVAYDREGDIDQAIVQYEAALRIQSDFAEVHNNLGIDLKKKGQIENAIVHFKEAVRINPTDNEPRKNLCFSLAYQGSIEEAFGDFCEAFKFKKGAADAHNAFGIEMIDLGLPGIAADEFGKAIQIQPDYAEPYNNLGYFYLQHGTNLSKAEELIGQAVKLNPTNADFLDSMGCLLMKQNRPAESRDYLLRAISHSPRPDASIYDHLGDLAAAQNQREQAADAWRKSLAIKADAGVQKKLDGLKSQ